MQICYLHASSSSSCNNTSSSVGARGMQIAKLEPCYQPAYKRGLRVGGEEREPRGLRVEGEDREPWDPRRESLTFERE
jgi:hypothetical protein